MLFFALLSALLIGVIQAQCLSTTVDGIQVAAANSGETVQIMCPAGSVLQAEATCSSSNYGSLTRLCTPISGSCEASNYMNANFPPTPAGAPAIGVCEAGYSGTPLRNCNNDGEWGTAVANPCQRITCPTQTFDNAVWPTTNSLTTAYATCNSGYIGAPSRECLADGTWGEVQGRCFSEFTCPAQSNYAHADWPQTNGGESASGECRNGWGGNPSRKCNLDGNWQSLVVSHCQRLTCPAFTDQFGVRYPSVLTFNYGFGTCPPGTSGDPRRYCRGDTTWNAPFGRRCV